MHVGAPGKLGAPSWRTKKEGAGGAAEQHDAAAAAPAKGGRAASTSNASSHAPAADKRAAKAAAVGAEFGACAALLKEGPQQEALALFVARLARALRGEPAAAAPDALEALVAGLVAHVHGAEDAAAAAPAPAAAAEGAAAQAEPAAAAAAAAEGEEEAPSHAAAAEDDASRVSTPYGLGTVAHERDDGVFVVKLAWATLYAQGGALSSPPEAGATEHTEAAS